MLEKNLESYQIFLYPAMKRSRDSLLEPSEQRKLS